MYYIVDKVEGCGFVENDSDGSAVLTKTAGRKIRKHMGINKKSTDKAATNALKYGVTIEETTGKLRKYMQQTYEDGGKIADNIRVYNRSCYVFRDDVLITMYKVPRELFEASDKAVKNKANKNKE